MIDLFLILLEIPVYRKICLTYLSTSYIQQKLEDLLLNKFF